MIGPRLCALLAACAVAGACSSPTTSSSSTFTSASGAACMDHQAKPPSGNDRSSHQDVAARLTVLRYYTAHGLQAFCDGHPASKNDLAWMRLFVMQGAEASLVSRWLPQ